MSPSRLLLPTGRSGSGCARHLFLRRFSFPGQILVAGPHGDDVFLSGVHEFLGPLRIGAGQDRVAVLLTSVFGEGDLIYKIDRYLAEETAMYGIMIIKKNDDGVIEYRIDAREGRWDGSRWIFMDGIKRTFETGGEIAEREIFDLLPTQIRDEPKYFGRDTRSVENMTIQDAARYVGMMKKMGFDHRRHLTRLNRKIANSITLLLVIVIGLSLGSMSFKNALVISFSMTLGIVLVFFFVIEIGTTMGTSGRIPPVVGGWLGNILFLMLAVYLIRKLRV